MASSVLDLIGQTPIIRLRHVVPSNSAEIWVKFEAKNPTGSYKDRMAVSIVRNAMDRGDVSVGDAVVEYTGGSTGSSLAFACAALGLKFTAVFSDAFSLSKQQTMEAFGATVIVEESHGQGITPDLIGRMKQKAMMLCDETGAFYADQFGSADVPLGFEPMGQEIAEELGDGIDIFCASVGTAGALMGT